MNSRIAKTLALLTTVLSVSARGAFAQTPETPTPAARISQAGVVKPGPPPAEAGVVERGRFLFQKRGCSLCHGSEGQGGVPNRNYIRDTVPGLDLPEMMKLREPGDVSAVVEQMKRGVGLDTLVDSAPVPQFDVVLAQYHSIQDVIRKGSPAVKKDPKGPAPPLNMPSWERELSEADIDAIVAYLLTLQPSKPPGQ